MTDISPQGQRATAQALTQVLAQLPAQQIPARTPTQQAAVKAAVQGLIQGLAQASSADDALAKTIAAAQSLPPDVLTQSVPANTPQAKAMLAKCPAIRFGLRPCRDNITTDANACSKPPYTGHLDECIPADLPEDGGDLRGRDSGNAGTARCLVAAGGWALIGARQCRDLLRMPL